MKRFYIVRHGEKVKKRGDPPLSDFGNVQAQQTANYLKTLPVSKIISSPMLRAQQTAQHIAKLIGVTSEIDNLLTERVNWGDDPTQSFEDFLTMWSKSSENREWQPPVGDSSLKSGYRLEKVIKDLLSYQNDHFVLVTHGGIIADFLRNIFADIELSRFIADFKSILDENIKECSITIIDVDTEIYKYILIKLASIDHLNKI